jgi:hypothetical protein
VPEKFLWEILVPTVHNDGRPFRTRYHRVWDSKIREISGGLTIMKPAIGQWVCEDTLKLYKERMIPVRIACTESQIKEIAQITLEYYEQIKVIYYRVADMVCIYPEE